MGGKLWTEEEIESLIEMLGFCTLATISKKLNRSELAIVSKMRKLKLGAVSSYIEGISANELAIVCKVSHKTVLRWIFNKKLKCKKKVLLKKHYYYFIKIDDFWKWAYENQESVKFYNIEKNILGKEPDWLKEKRLEEMDDKVKLKKHNKWTKQEDDLLRMLIGKYPYKEISNRLGRSTGAIKVRAQRMGLVRKSRIEWDEKEIQMLKELNSQGVSKYKIADILARHPSNIYEKLNSLEI